MRYGGEQLIRLGVGQNVGVGIRGDVVEVALKWDCEMSSMPV